MSTTTDTHEVLFTPFVTVQVHDGKVIGVEIDWSDSLRNVYTGAGEEVWEDGKGDAPKTATIACDYLDDATMRERILKASQPFFASEPPTG